MTQGLKLKFHAPPPLSYLPPPKAFPSKSQLPRIRPMIPILLTRKIIREITSPQLLFFSHIFLVPKKDQSFRLIIDLSLLNKYLVIPSFKMESVTNIASNITEPLWGCTIDLTDAFFHVPIHWFFQMFFAFVVDNRIFVFQFMPFGLSIAPWTFTRIIKPVKALVHKLSIRLHSFLDDFFLLASSPEGLSRITAFILALFRRLGFLVNPKKSNLFPSQKVEYLGVIFHLDSLQLSLPQSKILSISSLCRNTSIISHRSRRQLESFLGLLSWASSLVPLGRLKLLPLILWMNYYTSPASRDLQVPLDRSFKSHLHPWQDLSFLSSRVPMNLPLPSLQLMTDASLSKWSGILFPQDRRISGNWTPEDLTQSVNWLELKAIYLSLHNFLPLLQGQLVLLLSDSTTSVACIRNQGTLEIRTTNDSLSTNSQFLPSPLNNVSPQTPKRCPERLSGPRVPPHSSGNRVVSGSENLHLDSNASPEVPSRSLCHQGQQEGPQLRLPISRPSSLRSQCSFSSMGQLGLNLPIPPSSDSSSSHFSTFHLRRQRGPDSTILCSIRMVSQSPSSSSQPLPPSPFSHSLSNNYLRYNIPPQSWSFTTSRLDSIKRALLLKGHSRRSTKMILRCHKDSTNKTYECIWRKFLSFLSTRNIPHSTISIPIVCDFIEFQCTTMQRKYRTLATYKCALRYPILIACNLDINSLTTDLFMRGIFNYNPPIKAKGMPTWSINSVLRFLRSPVFEPLESASFVRLTQKALLLILLASGRRISEIANLSRSSTYLHARKALSLGWVEGFSPKNRTPNFSPENPSIGFLALNSIEDNNLCPVRAYKMYLLKSRELIDNFPLPPLPKCLWVRRRSSRPVNIKYLTDSLKNLIQDSRNFNNLNANIPIGPHQVKKLSASLAYQVGQDEIRVKQVMGFSSLSILRKNYVAFVRPLDIQCVLPGGTFTP